MHCYLDKRDGSDNWYIYVYRGKSQPVKRFSTRTADRTEAERKLAEFVLKAPERQEFADLTVLAMVIRYYETYGKNRFSADTIRRVIGLLADNEPTTRLCEFDLPRQEVFAQKC